VPKLGPNELPGDADIELSEERREIVLGVQEDDWLGMKP
jgi:hypothetical protein